jgi:hypothetical protein
VTKGTTGIWYLTIPGQTDSTGTLIISPEGGANLNVDNIVSYEWDATNSRWIIESRDLPGPPPGLQDGGSATEDMFSFAFFQAPPTAYASSGFTGTAGDAIADADLGTTGNQPAVLGTSAFTTIGSALTTSGSLAPFILNGGTFVVGTSSAGYSDTLGTLTLTANSVIDLGSFTGLHSLTFADSSGIAWATNATLTISNWQGTIWSPGTAGSVLFGVGGLTSAQLSQVRWEPQGYVGAGLINGLNGNGELTPIPEPRVYAAALALLAAVGWRERKRLLSLLRR